MAHYDELARVGRALSSPARLRLLDLLRQGPRSVEVLAEQSGLAVANVSQHLQQLRGAHLVASDKQGQRVVYRLATLDVDALFVALRRFGEAALPGLDRVKTVLQVHDDEHRNVLLRRIARGEVTVLDVRPIEEWQAGHLLDAVHIPLPELPTRVSELPKKRDVIAYCRGPFCPMALSAVSILRDAGYAADHLDLGPADVGGRARIRVARITSESGVGTGTAVATTAGTRRARAKTTTSTTTTTGVSARSKPSPRANSRKRSPA
jgi:DNA-binding transcriptional ArsR family regulator